MTSLLAYLKNHPVCVIYIIYVIWTLLPPNVYSHAHTLSLYFFDTYMYEYDSSISGRSSGFFFFLGVVVVIEPLCGGESMIYIILYIV